jgi:Uma2 family endonuclease
MSVMTPVIRHGPCTVDDLENFPDDGNRYELIDGMLLVSPAPNWAHQEMGATLYVQLRAACPNDLRVMIAPFAG